ncbi:hypothetical protein ATCV1_z056R [Acanthocystis turfacea chlorella virus 1]|uniref:Uncharacterized protein z056R n=1 Tax=Chlorovirus heliozoae TaxID=322019 RepID=A7K816_9PHYC|nr:hypothetical protein ATCV1_z056R [Acanthocystis turfacea chlorella virus 1]ABT16190.1 hypothetical protein ATCV1_z056R [Acanthocystis turfacea chlorella virus 1]
MNPNLDAIFCFLREIRRTHNYFRPVYLEQVRGDPAHGLEHSVDVLRKVTLCHSLSKLWRRDNVQVVEHPEHLWFVLYDARVLPSLYHPPCILSKELVM